MSNINIDFQVYDSYDPKQIIILDSSVWAFIENKRAVIEIITPGNSKPVGFDFTKKGVTLLNYIYLDINCNKGCPTDFKELPDGIYEITVKGSPENFYKKRFYLRTTLLELQLDEILIQNYSECNSCAEQTEDISRILRYKDLIKVADAFVRRNFNAEAQDIIFKIQRFVKNYHKNCKKCPHKA